MGWRSLPRGGLVLPPFRFGAAVLAFSFDGLALLSTNRRRLVLVRLLRQL